MTCSLLHESPTCESERETDEHSDKSQRRSFFAQRYFHAFCHRTRFQSNCPMSSHLYATTIAKDIAKKAAKKPTKKPTKKQQGEKREKSQNVLIHGRLVFSSSYVYRIVWKCMFILLCYIFWPRWFIIAARLGCCVSVSKHNRSKLILSFMCIFSMRHGANLSVVVLCSQAMHCVRNSLQNIHRHRCS